MSQTTVESRAFDLSDFKLHESILGTERFAGVRSKIIEAAELLSSGQIDQAQLKTNDAIDLVCCGYRELLLQNCQERGIPKERPERLAAQIPQRGERAPIGVSPALLEAAGLLDLKRGLIAYGEGMQLPEHTYAVRERLTEFEQTMQWKDAGDSLTWWLATKSLELPFADQRAFLERMAQFYKISKDKNLLENAAELTYHSWVSSVAASTEFGRDVPFSVADNFEQAITAREVPAYLGHDVTVTYIKSDGVYLITSHPKSLDLNSFKPSRHLVDIKFTNGEMRTAHTGPLNGHAGKTYALAIDRAEVHAALAELRKNEDYIFMDVRTGPGEKIPFKDPFDQEKRRIFFPATWPEPLSLTQVITVQAKAEPWGLMGNSGFHATRRTPEVTMDGVRVTFGNFPHGHPQLGPFGIEIDHRLSDKTWVQVESDMARVSSARVCMWSNGRISVTLNCGIKIPTEDIIPVADRHQYGARVNFSTWQSFASTREWNLVAGADLKIAAAHQRFSQPDTDLSYNGILKHTLHVPINRNPLEFGFDPELEKIGFASRTIGGKKVNCLTDMRLFSFPLEKPRPDQFDKKQLRALKPLDGISEKSWGALLKALEHRHLAGVADIEKISVEMDREKDKAPRSSVTHTNPFDLEIEIYQGSADEISVVGTWLVYHCHRGQRPYYLIDNPLQQNAIYLFSNLEGAIHEAKRFQSGTGYRIDALHHPSCIGRVVHAGEYLARIDDVVSQRLF